MNEQLRNRLYDLYQEFHDYDAKQPDRLNRWRNVEPESALFLSILVRSKQARQVLEIGTSNGFSTLWLADAVKATQGFLTSIEIEASRTAIAQNYLRQFGLDEHVTCLTVDAGHFLAELHQSYDVIFLDAERTAYGAYWPALKQLICQHPGTLLVVDNVISHREEVSEFLATIEADDEVMATVIAVGAGLLIVTKS